jgi:hypothetical protein
MPPICLVHWDIQRSRQLPVVQLQHAHRPRRTSDMPRRRPRQTNPTSSTDVGQAAPGLEWPGLLVRLFACSLARLLAWWPGPMAVLIMHLVGQLATQCCAFVYPRLVVVLHPVLYGVQSLVWKRCRRGQGQTVGGASVPILINQLDRWPACQSYACLPMHSYLASWHDDPPIHQLNTSCLLACQFVSAGGLPLLRPILCPIPQMIRVCARVCLLMSASALFPSLASWLLPAIICSCLDLQNLGFTCSPCAPVCAPDGAPVCSFPFCVSQEGGPDSKTKWTPANGAMRNQARSRHRHRTRQGPQTSGMQRGTAVRLWMVGGRPPVSA